MSEQVDKNYVKHYVDKASNTDNEALKNDCLYRAGTQMEVIPCTGNANLTPEQQEIILDAAQELLGEDDAYAWIKGRK